MNRRLFDRHGNSIQCFSKNIDDQYGWVASLRATRGQSQWWSNSVARIPFLGLVLYYKV